jgi:peptidoglycan/LPS O-acetylase OafA/YrhL
VLSIAVHPTKHINPIPDLSYGVYCWGFLIEQLIVNYLNPHNRAILFGLNLLLVLPPALLSWYAIESKALAYRSWPIEKWRLKAIWRTKSK